jgi:hypothetical protein
VEVPSGEGGLFAFAASDNANVHVEAANAMAQQWQRSPPESSSIGAAGLKIR